MAHFTYEPEQDVAKTELYQGDVLARTSELDKLLKEVHPHFHSKSNNLYFMVLTQSCDLVLRDGEACKSPYITIAPVRPLDAVIQRELQKLKLDIASEAPILTEKSRAKMQQFLQRLFNNNEPGYFFLDATDTELPEDCAAFINLSISLKSSLHYETCVSAKRLQLTEAFQAKLGWLVAQMFSRVGTADWDPVTINQKIKSALSDAAFWVQEDAAASITKEYETKREIDPGVSFSGTDIRTIVRKIPSKKSQVLDQAQVVLTQTLQHREDKDVLVASIMKRLRNDTGLTSLLPR